MEQYLSSMVDAHERYSEAFIALVEEYNTLGEHISSLGEAKQSNKEASMAMVAQFNAAGGPRFNDSTIQNLNAQHERFILECENFRAFIDSRFQHIRELVVALPTDSTEAARVVSPENAQLRDHLVQSTQGQEDMESDTGHEDEADASEECKMVLSHALANLDLNSPPVPEETLNNDVPTQEEPVDHKMAASQGSIALLEKYNTLGEQMSNLGDAIQSSIAIMARLSDAGAHGIDDSVIQNLNAQHDRLILACENFSAFISFRSEQIRELAVDLPTNSKEAAPVVSRDDVHPRDCLVDEADTTAATRLTKQVETYLTSMISALVMYTDNFSNMVHQYSARKGHLLDEIVPPVQAAHKRYILAMAKVQSAFFALCYTDMASVFLAGYMKDIIKGIDDLQDEMLLECAHFINSGLGSVRYKSEDPARLIKGFLVSLADANETYRETLVICLDVYSDVTGHHVDNLVVPNIGFQHKRLQTEGGKFIEAINKRKQIENYLEWFKSQQHPLPVPVLTVADQAKTALSVVPLRYMESGRGHEECEAYVSGALADLDLSRPQPEETAEDGTEDGEERKDRRFTAPEPNE